MTRTQCVALIAGQIVGARIQAEMHEDPRTAVRLARMLMEAAEEQEQEANPNRDVKLDDLHRAVVDIGAVPLSMLR
jgi:hypothetical protein